jgi:predicted DCC family thiol-disulfide oxidoreductase YuxK
MSNNATSITVLYDGSCPLCRRSVSILHTLDWNDALTYVNFRDENAKNSIAPDLKIEDLDRAMHVRFAHGKTYKGFYAFRSLAWYIPLMWMTIPFLYCPGVPLIGNTVYTYIAHRRKKCTDESCRV